MMIAAMEELNIYLADLQHRRATRVACELSPRLSACMSDAMLVEALILGLPMAQGVQYRILRSRGRGVVLTAKVRYRDAVRMLDGKMLSVQEQDALAQARFIAAEAMRREDEQTRFQFVFDWVCSNVRYIHTAPGRIGYERLVSAAGALMDGQANCQGFADVLYLLCGLCGIACQYRIGRGERRLHVWNAVCIDGVWLEKDASKGARGIGETGDIDNSPTNFASMQKNTTQETKNMLY